MRSAPMLVCQWLQFGCFWAEGHKLNIGSAGTASLRASIKPRHKTGWLHLAQHGQSLLPQLKFAGGLIVSYEL